MSILPPNPENFTLETIWGNSDSLINRVTTMALEIGGGIAVIFILIGAFWYFTAYGNEEKANKGKTTIMWAIIGILVILFSKVIIIMLKNLLT